MPTPPYKTIKTLGRGGFGIVELVSDATGSQFARKTFSINQPLSPSLAENVKKRFVREARVQIGLQHKNIVPILAESLSSNPPYYFMPVAIANLDDEIEQDKSIGGGWRSAIMDIISGLEELHSIGMCHRDLKPGNVLKFKGANGGADYYAISDFGFISLKDSRLSTLTKTGMKKGSDFYSAPEIVADLRKASPQSDIYSLGCILHDMVGQEDRVPCAEIKEDGPFGPLLLSCTRQQSQRRFKSVRAIADALLSMEDDIQVLSSSVAGSYAEALDGSDPISAKMWRDMTEYLDRNSDTADGRVLLMKLTAERIEELCKTNLEEANKLGVIFARWVYGNSFNFDTCDPLANRLDVFFDSCSFDVKAECLLAMLELGTSHNRWYVERKFAAQCGGSMDPALAKRLSVEFRAAGESICYSIDHLERSIGFNRANLHPVLAKTLSEMCS